MRLLTAFFGLLLSLVALTVEAATPPLLVLDVARFRNEDQSVKGGILEIYATVPGQGLTYKRRGPKVFQAAATLTLEVLYPDGTAAYQEVVTLKPPVLSDTSNLKNPISFQKRIALPDGTYTLRGQVRDQYRAGRVVVVDMPLVLESKSKAPVISNIVLLARPASKTLDQSNFIRGSYSLTRAPGGLYARGADRLFFYAELYNAAPDQPVQLRYKVRPVAGTKDILSTTATATGLTGRSTPLIGDLDISKLPAGEYTLTVEARDAKNKLLSAQTTRLRRNPAEYAPAGAALPR
ncbi:hypothetical protein SAMN02745146_2158 [Hymenobacter daecheongensis DSM 21074]|uniref:Uncharacterized protein n=1 Tax=Hymenobacter daecheongensis DSM 21074 TaxID=1121955 RepID=A0A1M6G8A7_9BACT|nr:hypothetical protein [Hymenobacter daecheongensis]SHJ06176.1 hypothetical protein SAMN02745146_2158 [Hymenobacter daecheongensis DSM 21074]